MRFLFANLTVSHDTCAPLPIDTLFNSSIVILVQFVANIILSMPKHIAIRFIRLNLKKYHI